MPHIAERKAENCLAHMCLLLKPLRYVVFYKRSFLFWFGFKYKVFSSFSSPNTEV